MDKVVILVKNNWTSVLGAFLGGIAGYFYWLFVGCSTGTCPITSSPVMTVAWGSLMGALLFGMIPVKKKESLNLKLLLAEGAILLDVRTVNEYAIGNVPDSINMPLDTLASSLEKLDKNKIIIAVCKSGMRSNLAVSILRKNGFMQVYNGGSWNNFKQ